MNPTRRLPATVATIIPAAFSTSRRHRIIAAAAAMIPLVAAAPAGPVAAGDPSADGPGWAPITQAARYIDVPVNTLSAHVIEHARAGEGLGFGIVLDMLDAAETAKLAAVSGPTESNVFQVRHIVEEHDDLEELVMAYAVSNLLPRQLAP